jgi:hypothetical protein
VSDQIVEKSKTAWHLNFPWTAVIVVMTFISSLLYNEHRITAIEVVYAAHAEQDAQSQQRAEAFRTEIWSATRRIEDKLDRLGIDSARTSARQDSADRRRTPESEPQIADRNPNKR